MPTLKYRGAKPRKIVEPSSTVQVNTPTASQVRDVIDSLKSKYSQSQLEEAFKVVQPASHWKNPIYKVIPDIYDRALIAESIVHFTATEATFTPAGEGYVKVTADGYFAGPAGDH